MSLNFQVYLFENFVIEVDDGTWVDDSARVDDPERVDVYAWVSGAPYLSYKLV